MIKKLDFFFNMFAKKRNIFNFVFLIKHPQGYIQTRHDILINNSKFFYLFLATDGDLVYQNMKSENPNDE